MTIKPITKTIRAKKLGVLIRDARLKTAKSVEECAKAMGISADEMTAMEYGERPPTLPELEILAYSLEVPLEHFWGNQVLITNGSDKSVDAAEIKQLRQSIIGDLIRKARTSAAVSVEELAETAGITPETLQAYEQGEAAIPLPELEVMSQVLNNPLNDYKDRTSKVGNYFMEQEYIHEFINLPLELQAFVSKPVNRPYLELAIKLSEIKAEKLRALAEGLLEITL